MKISTFLRFLFCAFVASGFSMSALAQSAAGQIRAAKVQGEVSKLSVSGAITPLANGEKLVETDTVITGKSASVVLVFQNGSSVRVGAESRLAIEEFKMDPLDRPIGNLSALKAEPSTSKTVLNLSYGEMVGDVKKLNAAAGSSYKIKTPVGAAGIRGTVYRIVFKPSSNGKAFFTISTAEGTVIMENVTSADIPVEAGKEVVVEIDTDNPGNPVVVSQDIDPSVLAAITVAAQELAQTLKENQDSSDSKQEDGKTPEEQEKQDPAPPTPPPPPLTAKAGE